MRVAAGESVLIELVETRTLRVRATHANSGAPAFIEELLLSATDDTARSIKPRNASTSELSIEGVRPGTYHALVRTIDGSVGLQVIEVAPSEFTAPEMTLEVEPGARLALDNSSGMYQSWLAFALREASCSTPWQCARASRWICSFQPDGRAWSAMREAVASIWGAWIRWPARSRAWS